MDTRRYCHASDPDALVREDGPSARRIGLIAGWGRYPLLLAQSLKLRGYEVACLGIRDHADPGLAAVCDRFAWIGLGQVGRGLRLLKQWRVQEATLAGKVHKVTLFRPWMWWHHFPDWKGFCTFAPHFLHRSRDNRDDSLLTTVCKQLEAAGIPIRPATAYLPEVLVSPGALTPAQLTPRQWRDVVFGWQVAKEIGRLDIGQTVVVKDQAVLAVEAIEGTDACIRRAGELCPAGGFTVVKVAKPQQDMRFDVPTVGVLTLETMAAAGAAVLAVEAGKTILLDPDRVVEIACRHHIKIIATQEAEILAAAA